MTPGMLRKNRRLRLPGGRSLRLLTAMEVLEARREAEELAKTQAERALCSNACLLARALERRGVALFADGQAVLKGMQVEEIGDLARQWARFNRREHPAKGWGMGTVEQIKKAWSTHRKNG